MADRLTVRMIVAVLGFIAVTIVVGGIWLANEDKSLTDALIAIGAGAVGSLSSFLVSTRGGSSEPVTVTNPPTAPVPVEPAGD